MGVMYFEGRGVKKNEVEAVKWYRLAAAQNEADAYTTWVSRVKTGAA